MANTKQIGDVSEGMILAELLGRGETVLIPFGDNQRYDLVVDRFGAFERIQCKTGRLSSDKKSVSFKVSSSSAHRSGGGRRDYRGEIEYFMVYCPGNKKIYKIGVDQVGVTDCVLRLEAPANNQKSGVRMASVYEY